MKKLILAALSCILLPGILNAQNLISNPSFENNGQPSGQGWYDNCGPVIFTIPDTVCAASYSTDAGPGGGTYSLLLNAQGNMPPAYAITYIQVPATTDRYTLNLWMKKAGTGTASVSLLLISNNITTVLKTVYDTSAAWAQYMLIDTVTTVSIDTIAVRFDAAAAGPAYVDLYADLLDLQGIGIVGVNEEQQENHSLFPNPMNDHATIITNRNNCIFTLYNSFGEVVRTAKFSNELMLNRDDLASGMYYYRIDDGERIRPGKLIVR